jgi:hypothetical protein
MNQEKRDARRTAEFLKFSPEHFKYWNDKQRQHAEKEAADFHADFAEGRCSVCGHLVTSYTKGTPCLHWLLGPVGFEKNDLPRIAKRWGMGQIQLFLRRVANEEGFATNINDLAIEGSGKIVELTIKSKNQEWSFSCGDGDYEGHESDSRDSRRPHYHLQMRVNELPFIDYNDFHLPFSARDMRVIEATRIGAANAVYVGGEGLSDVLTGENLERLATKGTPVEEDGKGLVKLDQFLVSKKPGGMRGEDIMAAIQEARAQNKPMTDSLREIPDAAVTTIVSPGPGTATQALRKGGRKKRRRRS